MTKPDLKAWEKFRLHLLNESVTQKRVNKLRQMFNTVSRGVKKNINKLQRPDIENFINDLLTNKFKRRDKKPFSGSSKSDIKKFLKQYFKWLRGNNEAYPKEVSWIKTKIGKDERPEEKPIISVNEVMKLSNSFSKAEQRILTLILFDSGFRIQEALSIKKSGLTWEEYNEGQKCFWVLCSESKTIKRKIPIGLFTEDIKAFINSTYYRALDDDDLIFQFEYGLYLKNLNSNSKKVLNKHITCHCLRHSSATYYSKEFDGNMNMIADRYGWTYSSKELATYIRRSGAYQKQGAKKVFSNELMKVKGELAELKETVKKLALRMFDKDFKKK